tara:strand:- start:3 stop:842 length:840 start_codon:yes stop_codon:yes gene_type:complete
MGDSSDNSNDSDESIEVAERRSDEQTGNFGGDSTNINETDKGIVYGYAGDTPQQRAITELQYDFGQKQMANQARRGNIPGVNLQPSTQDIQTFSRQQNEIDERGFDPTQEQINVGPGDIFGLENQIAENLRQGGKASFNPQGNIIGATGYGPAFGGMGVLSAMLPDVTTYTGLREGDPFNQDDPYSFMDNNDEPNIIRRRMSAETVPIEEEEVDPALSDDLAVNYLQNPYYGYSGQGNLYQPYGYAQNTLVDLLRTRNMTQPQQRAANLGLFGNPGDFS